MCGPELSGVTHVSVMAIISGFLDKKKINASSLVKFAVFTSDLMFTLMPRNWLVKLSIIAMSCMFEVLMYWLQLSNKLSSKLLLPV